MNRLKIKIFSFIIVILFFYVQLLFSGTTGKIAGQVTDKETGNPIPGANVFIVESTMGAAADEDGYFTILNVPPGEYSVSAVVVGYAEMTVTDVRVIIDQTARIDFELQVELLEGETVVVIAERRPVKADVATSTAAITSEDISVLPLTNIQDVVGLQAGIEDGLVIRGGAAEQALFQYDGITLRDPRNNKPITNVAMSALQEVTVERGGFNAEYGQVRSGIVNIVSREGSITKYYGKIIGKASPPTQKYYDVSPFDANATMLRPYLDPAVAWTGTKSGAWDEYDQRQYPEFEGWNSVSNRLMTDTDPDNDLSPAAAQELFRWQHRRKEKNDAPDYNVDASFGGPVPYAQDLGNLRFFTSYRQQRDMLLVPLSRDDYKEWFWSLKLNANISPTMKLTATSMIGKSYHVAQNEAGVDNSTQYIQSSQQVAAQVTNMDYPRAVDSRLFVDSYFSNGDVLFNSFSAKLTHTLDPLTYYDASIEIISREYSIQPIRLRDMTENIEFIPGHFTNESPFGFSPVHDPGIDGMMTGGHTSTARDFSNISATMLKFDISSQLNPSNLLKAGVELVSNNLNLEYGEEKLIYVDGNTYVTSEDSPLRLSVYIQDKLEFESLVVNAGLRMEYTNSNNEWADVEPFDKDFYSSNYVEGSDYNTKSSEPRITFSPRLGISHPITVDAKLFFNYGHFRQLPTYEQILRLSRGGSNEVQGIGDPDLLLENTIAYELGYDHALWEDYLIQIAAFYRDIFWQRDYTQYISADASVNYLQATNNLYEDIRGFEVTFRKPRGKWWTAFINYTYQVSTQGHFNVGQVYQDPKEQREYDRQTSNMYQERPLPQPYARAQINLNSPPDLEPSILGDWNLNILADWRDGPWLTWNPSRKLNVAQNVKAKDWFNLQLRLMKRIKLDRFTIALFVDVYNALNTKRLSLNSFYDGFDYQYYFESLHLPESGDYNNIVGEDKIGDYREIGVPYQPIEQVGDVYAMDVATVNERVIYYNRSTRQYMNYKNGSWSKVDDARMEQVFDDKAYIDMPNHTYFHFLDLRQIFFGIDLSFEL